MDARGDDAGAVEDVANISDTAQLDVRAEDTRRYDASSDVPSEEPDAQPPAPDVDAEEPDAQLGEADVDVPDIDETDIDETDIDETDIEEAPPGPFVLWMAPDGSDSRDGSTLAKAVKTMGRVQDLLEENAPERDVEVRIAPGHYRGQKVNWTFSVPGHTVTFTRLAGEESRPIFDGCLSADNCPGGTWFKLSRSDGAETGIVFNYLKIQNYRTAISFNGARNAEATSNGSNEIYGCYFDRIGNVFNSAVEPSTAAVRLVNSDDNKIINNHFVDIINTRSPARLHAIYIAHMSDRNQILRNRFKNNAGEPIRVRDYSNDNIINDNTFIRVAPAAAYGDWYCDHDARTDCTKAGPECPSWGNEFRDNHLSGTYACESLGVFRYYQGDSTSGCSPPSAGARRLRTSGNTHASTPCQ